MTDEFRDELKRKARSKPKKNGMRCTKTHLMVGINKYLERSGFNYLENRNPANTNTTAAAIIHEIAVVIVAESLASSSINLIFSSN